MGGRFYVDRGSVFGTLRFYRHVIYVQGFVANGKRNIRGFVVGGKVVAAMYGVSDSWKTNLSQEAIQVKANLVAETEKLALQAAKVSIAGHIAGHIVSRIRR